MHIHTRLYFLLQNCIINPFSYNTYKYIFGCYFMHNSHLYWNKFLYVFNILLLQWNRSVCVALRQGTSSNKHPASHSVWDKQTLGQEIIPMVGPRYCSSMPKLDNVYINFLRIACGISPFYIPFYHSYGSIYTPL